jgi:hypothetical protein
MTTTTITTTAARRWMCHNCYRVWERNETSYPYHTRWRGVCWDCWVSLRKKEGCFFCDEPTSCRCQ